MPSLESMRPQVTAIIVAHNGARFIERTLDSVGAQTRLPDTVIGVDVASKDDTARLLASDGVRDARGERVIDRIVKLPAQTPYGRAVMAAVQASSADAREDEWLWLLAADTAPEPDALEQLLEATEVGERIVAVGAKLMEADRPQYIAQFGQTLTRFGKTVLTVDNDIDQGQYDDASDTLGFAPQGMLIKRSHLVRLAGFDRGLPTYDQGLDFGVRTWLAGQRVIAAPKARLQVVSDVPRLGPLRTHASVAKKFRLRRQARLHRRLVYAPAWALPLQWLALVPLAIVRAIVQLARKQPAAIPGELGAALTVAFGGTGFVRSRQQFARTKQHGMAHIAPFRQSAEQSRRKRIVEREQLAQLRSDASGRIQFFLTGGGWVLLFALALSIVLMFPLLQQGALSGGALLPLSDSIGALWSHVLFGELVPGSGQVGPADPFNALLAVLGTLTFWKPSLAVLILWVLAMPLAALGAWLAAAHITVKSWSRALAALAYLFAPPFFEALLSGRLPAVIVHVTLPWLIVAAMRAPRSWPMAAWTALLATIVAVSSPSLIPALAVLWVVGMVLSGRRFARVLLTAVLPIVTMAPLAIADFTRGTPLALFADPGVPTAYRPAAALDLMTGAVSAQLGTLPHSIFGALGIAPLAETTGSLLLVAPLIVVAALGLLVTRVRYTIALTALIVTGYASAVAATHLAVTVVGSEPVFVWAGSGLSLMWLGLVGAAVAALAAMRRLHTLVHVLVTAGSLGLVAVLAFGIIGGRGGVHPVQSASLPAVVAAESAAHEHVRMAVITPRDANAISVRIDEGAGRVLDGQSTYVATSNGFTAETRELATLAGTIATRDDQRAAERLRDLGVDFVLVERPSGTGAEFTDSADDVMSINGGLQRVSESRFGVLFEVRGADLDAGPATAVDTHPELAQLIFWVQLATLLATVLMLIPAGSLANRGALIEEYRRSDETSRDGGRRGLLLDDDGRVAGGAVEDETLRAFLDEPTGEAIGVGHRTGRALVEDDDDLEPATSARPDDDDEDAPRGAQVQR